MKPAAFYIALLITLPLQGQIPLRNDTVLIEEVTISRKKTELTPATRKLSLGTHEIQYFQGGPISELLTRNTNIIIRGYGPGGSASAAVRGTAANHTQLNWNGINIGNPMLGQADLSLVPAGFVDDIHIFYGGGSIKLNSGGIGGIIALETKPEWTGGNKASFSAEAGSFGKTTGLVKIMAGNSKSQSVTRAFFHSAINNFSYLNEFTGPEPVKEQRAFNSVLQKGFMQELWLRSKGNIISARLWYQAASRELPPPVIIHKTESDEKQFDESLKALIDYKNEKGRNTINVTIGALFDKLNYNNTTVSVDSRNNIASFTAATRIETALGDNARLLFSANNEINIVTSNNYGEKKLRNIFALMASAHFNLEKGITGELLIRETILDNSLMTPDIYAGFTFNLRNENRNMMKASYSRNSRFPSLNDLYWIPGGNPDLENENAHALELTWEGKRKLLSRLSFNSDMTLFGNSITNMIKWAPGDFSYWEPSNIGQVNTSGIESAVELLWSGTDFEAGMKSLYTYTRAINRTIS
ncbi:MAG TPA: TonB-dependent receptor, partial [Bacteroidales bacterium]|nr:TonB-dependent receptor [Bacteroidales bacterium]